jgi:hypothetical protein
MELEELEEGLDEFAPSSNAGESEVDEVCCPLHVLMFHAWDDAVGAP